MLFRSYKPRAPLCEFVEDFWLYQDYCGQHARERILPSGTFEMVFNLREDELRIYGPQREQCRRYAGAVISGPYAGSFMSDVAGVTSTLASVTSLIMVITRAVISSRERVVLAI